MTARRFRLGGIVFLPGKTNLRCASLKRCGPRHHGRSTSSRIEIRLSRTEEGQPSRGETAPDNCGCADAYEELPRHPPYDADTRIPPAQSPNGGPGARETLRPEPAEAPEPMGAFTQPPASTPPRAQVFPATWVSLKGGEGRCP